MIVDFVEGALPYVERLDWKVFLLAPGLKVPYFAKARGGNGVHDASSSPDQIRAWGKICPRGNIGIACGPIAVVDVDPRNGGDVSLAALAAKGRVLPQCPRQRTGNGGWHYVFKGDAIISNSKGRLGPGIEIKSSGGYIVGAPSWIKASKGGPGGSYAWQVSPFEVPAPRMPIWMTAILCPPPRPIPAYVSDGKGGDIEPLARFVASSPVGERNNRLFWAASRARDLVAKRQVSESASIHRLTVAAEACGLKGPEVLRTIKSGLNGADRGNP